MMNRKWQSFCVCRHLLTVVLAVVMVLTAGAAAVYANMTQTIGKDTYTFYLATDEDENVIKDANGRQCVMINGYEQEDYGRDTLEIPSSLKDSDGNTYTVYGFTREARGMGYFQTLAIPETVVDIPPGCFNYWQYDYDNLRTKEFRVDEKNPAFCAKDGVLYDKDVKWLVCYPPEKNDTTYKAPRSLKGIEDYSLYQNDYLERILFSYTEGLELVGTPSYCSFKYNENNFGHMENLKTIVLPDKMEDFVIEPFDAPKLTKYVIADDNEQFYTKDGILFEVEEDPKTKKTKKILWRFPNGKKGDENGAYEVPAGVSLGEACFYDNEKLKEIVVSGTSKEIPDRAFWGCQKLEILTIPSSVKELGSQCFAYCENLLEIKIPKGVTGLPSGMCEYCDSLVSVTIPASVNWISEDAFNNCDELEAVFFEGTKAQWDAIEIEDGNDGLENATIYYQSADYTPIDKDSYGYKSLKSIQHSLPSFSFEGDNLNGPDITVHSKKYKLFSYAMKMKLPFSDRVTVNVNEKEGTAQAIIGLAGFSKQVNSAEDSNQSYWTDTYAEVKKMVNACGMKTNRNIYNGFRKIRKRVRAVNGSLGFGGSCDVIGYANFILDEDGAVIGLDQNDMGGIMIIVKANASVKAPIVAVIYGEFSIEGEVDGKVYIEWNKKKCRGMARAQLGLKITPGVAIGAKAAFVDVKGGIKGEMAGTLDLPWVSAKKSIYITFDGKMFVQVESAIPQLNYYKDKSLVKVEIYPKMRIIENDPSKTKFTYQAAEPLTKDEISEVKANKALLSGNIEGGKSTGSVVDSAVYEFSGLDVIKLEDGRYLMTYVDDTADETTGQSKLMYRIYENNSWSEGREVAPVSNLNTRGKLAAGNDGTAYVVFESSDKEITEDMGEEEIASSMDLYAAVFDGDTFSKASKIADSRTNSEGITPWIYNFDVINKDDYIYARWAENTAGDITCQEGTTVLKQCELEYDDEEGLICYDADEITSIDYAIPKITFIGNETYGDAVYTRGDQCYLINENGGQEEIDLSEYGESVDSPVMYGDDLYARIDNQLYRLSYEEEEIEDEYGDVYDAVVMKAHGTGIEPSSGYVIAGDTVYWPVQSGFTNELYKQKLGDADANPVQITDEGGYINAFQVLTEDTEAPLFVYTNQVVDEEADEPFGITVLKFQKNLKTYRAAVLDAMYDYEDLKPGEKADFTVTIANTGSEELTNVKVNVMKDDTVIGTYDAMDSLPAGEQVDLDLAIDIPDGFETSELKFALTADQTLAASDAYDTTVYYSNLDVELTQPDSETLVVTNRSETGASGVTVNVYDGSDASGTMLKTYSVGSLAAGASKTVSVSEVWDSAAEDEYGSKTIYCSVTQNEEDSIEWNNVITIYKGAEISNSDDPDNPDNPDNPDDPDDPDDPSDPYVWLFDSPFVYNGKEHRPDILVMDADGNILIELQDYTVEYLSDCREIGAHYLAVKFKGAYAECETVLEEFLILPAKVTLSKVKKGKKCFTAKWKACAGGVAYQLQYRQKGQKKWKSKSAKKTSLKVKKLKSRKIYQVRVRAVKDLNGSKYYGKWSAVKKVKIK